MNHNGAWLRASEQNVCPWPRTASSERASIAIHPDLTSREFLMQLNPDQPMRSIYRSRCVSRWLDWQCISSTRRHCWYLIVLRLLIRHWIFLLVQIGIVVNWWLRRILIHFAKFCEVERRGKIMQISLVHRFFDFSLFKLTKLSLRFYLLGFAVIIAKIYENRKHKNDFFLADELNW